MSSFIVPVLRSSVCQTCMRHEAPTLRRQRQHVPSPRPLVALQDGCQLLFQGLDKRPDKQCVVAMSLYLPTQAVCAYPHSLLCV